MIELLLCFRIIDNNMLEGSKANVLVLILLCDFSKIMITCNISHGYCMCTDTVIANSLPFYFRHIRLFPHLSFLKKMGTNIAYIST